ncbi:carboxypeptidase regulatory-like domain-containing protein [Bradyrhizobium sp. NBAIM32]|uniref:carboxypeptidase regulatory-like domain-containing protein n=1 Tax=Bradyrhizobium sp. NBAIM32 TaxID=2793809 RepID=UPI001CD52BF0|nr:carboxypeptidase-like regulatory domain-containing protein [Bradyrhizobium sp. NBAIM32]MCA1542240.1 carboxypeptidase regulatory-like domain-containing protein [Bradyrhizobium sp. NBAIM32]
MPDERILHHGRVIDRYGAGVGDALVYVVHGTASTPEIAVKCDASGRFRLALPPGHFKIEARSMAGAIGATDFDVGTGDERIEIIIDQ